MFLKRIFIYIYLFIFFFEREMCMKLDKCRNIHVYCYSDKSSECFSTFPQTMFHISKVISVTPSAVQGDTIP